MSMKLLTLNPRPIVDLFKRVAVLISVRPDESSGKSVFRDFQAGRKPRQRRAATSTRSTRYSTLRPRRY